MSDIVTRLRQTRANMIGTDDEQHFFDCHEAAGEIARLRQRGRLTDAERHCLRKAVEMLADDADREDGIARSQIAAVLSDVADRMIL